MITAPEELPCDAGETFRRHSRRHRNPPISDGAGQIEDAIAVEIGRGGDGRVYGQPCASRGSRPIPARCRRFEPWSIHASRGHRPRDPRCRRRRNRRKAFPADSWTEMPEGRGSRTPKSRGAMKDEDLGKYTMPDRMTTRSSLPS